MDKGQMNSRDKEVSRAIGDVLTRAKSDAGLTFDDLAQMTGLSRPHVTRILYGTIDPRVGDLRRLCELLEVDTHSVLCGALAPQLTGDESSGRSGPDRAG